MKNFFLSLSITCAMLSTGSLYGQQFDKTNNNYFTPNVLKVNVLSPFVLTASVFYERVVQKQKSLQVGFFYSGVSIGDTKFRGFGVTPEFRFYFSATTAPEGFYVAPFLKYQRFHLRLNESDSTYQLRGTYGTFGGGGVAGKQWVFNNNMTMDVFLGFSYNIGHLTASEGETNDFNLKLFSGFSPRVGVTVGYSF